MGQKPAGPVTENGNTPHIVSVLTRFMWDIPSRKIKQGTKMKRISNHPLQAATTVSHHINNAHSKP